MGPRASIRGIGVAIGLLTAILAAAPAGAESPAPTHGGTRGVHMLVDRVPEFAAARCEYDENGVLEAIRVAAPVAFAANLSRRDDSHTVRWRTYIEADSDGPGWAEIARTSWQAATATEAHPAHLTARRVALDIDAGTVDYVRARARIQWRAGGGTIGSAQHWIESYGLAKAGTQLGIEYGGCPSLLTSSLKVAHDDGIEDHSDSGFGVHALIEDTRDLLKAARCIYDDAHHLAKIKVRMPILYARDRTLGIDEQVVGARFVIQYANDPIDGPWFTLPGARSSLRKVTTSDRHIAHLRGWTYTFDPGVEDDHPYWRVLVQGFWFKPGSDSTVQGRADHAPIDYDGDWTADYHADACYAVD